MSAPPPWREQKTAAAPRVQRAARFSWCKIPNEFPDYPLLRAAALVAKVPVHQVIAVALRLECLANASLPRGSVADFSAAEFAASLQLRPDAVARIRAALEDPDIFWIDDQDFITGFSARNPESDDHTAAERQRRHRAKLKAERETAAQAARAGWTEPIHSHVTSRRDTVTCHAREEKNRNPLCREEARAGPAVDNCADNGDGFAASGLSDGCGPGGGEQQKLAAHAWLEREGIRIVIEQLQEGDRPTLAATKIARWRDQELGGDAVALMRIIQGAQKADYSGPRFLNLIVDGIRAAQRQATQQGELRLPVPLRDERKLG